MKPASQQTKPVHLPVDAPAWRALYGGVVSTLIALISLIRGSALFLSGRPRTPLRILCIVAFDALHARRHGRGLPMGRLRLLGALLDFAACANAGFDGKKPRLHEYRATWRLLERAGIGPSAADYVRRLGILERARPRPGGDPRDFQKVSSYREAVARLSLGLVATVARGHHGLDQAIDATYRDDDIKRLFLIVMQCQIIDDVLDYSQDRTAGLPSFLTACESVPQALALTRRAARAYADERRALLTTEFFPLRFALILVPMCTELLIARRGCRLRQDAEKNQGARVIRGAPRCTISRITSAKRRAT